MPADVRSKTRNYLERRLFDHFLRTGVQVDIDAVALAWERKFNPYHDPDDGRFTFGPGGGSLAVRRQAQPVLSTVVATKRPTPTFKPRSQGDDGAKPEADLAAKRQPDIGTLSAKYESVKLEGPGTISSGRGDPGGASYGTFQLSSRKGKVQEFVASPEAGPWRSDLHGKTPVTKAFDDQWRAIAARNPVEFEAAQRAFVVRTNYSQGAKKVRIEAGYDLDKSSPAVRQAFFSTAVQHGPTGGGGLFARAVKAVDSKMTRTDPRYESALINLLFDNRAKQRSDFASALKLRANALIRLGKAGKAKALFDKARLAENDVRSRYPKERYDALLLLSGQPITGH